MYTIGLQTLRAKIRGFQAAGSTLAAYAGKAQRKKKHRLRQLKRALGVECRNHLIAYGLLRGVPYHRIERCAPNNRPDPQAVLAIVLSHNTGTLGRPTTFDRAAVEALLASTAHEAAPEKGA